MTHVTCHPAVCWTLQDENILCDSTSTSFWLADLGISRQMNRSRCIALEDIPYALLLQPVYFMRPVVLWHVRHQRCYHVLPGTVRGCQGSAVVTADAYCKPPTSCCKCCEVFPQVHMPSCCGRCAHRGTPGPAVPGDGAGAAGQRGVHQRLCCRHLCLGVHAPWGCASSAARAVCCFPASLAGGVC